MRMLFLFALMLSAHAFNVEDLIPQDPAFDFPLPTKPDVTCSACGGTEGLDLVEEDKAIMSIPADLYAPQFTRSLLRVEAGIPNYQWDPSRVYTLVATGRKGTHGSNGEVSEVTAFLQRVIVIFTISRSEEGEVSLECKSHPDEVSIGRRGNELCLTTGSGNQYFFETDDFFGKNWRLTGLSHRLYTWRTQIEYQEQAVSRIIYPDQTICELESENGLCVSATFPNGEKLVIGRDPAGYISSVECFARPEESTRKELVRFTSRTDANGQEQTQAIYRTVTEQAEPVCYKRYLFDSDHKGRLAQIVTPCGKEITLEYLFHQLDKGVREYSIYTTDTATGIKRYLKHLVTAKHIWILETGRIAADNPSSVKVDYRKAMQKIGNKWQVIREWTPTYGERTFEYDRQTGQRLPTRNQSQTDRPAPIQPQQDNLGRILLQSHGETCTRIFYHPDGTIAAMLRLPDTPNQQAILAAEKPEELKCSESWLFSYDQLQRITQVVQSDGTVMTWSRDSRGLTQPAQLFPSARDAAIPHLIPQ